MHSLVWCDMLGPDVTALIILTFGGPLTATRCKSLSKSFLRILRPLLNRNLRHRFPLMRLPLSRLTIGSIVYMTTNGKIEYKLSRHIFRCPTMKVTSDFLQCATVWFQHPTENIAVCFTVFDVDLMETTLSDQSQVSMVLFFSPTQDVEIAYMVYNHEIHIVNPAECSNIWCQQIWLNESFMSKFLKPDMGPGPLVVLGTVVDISPTRPFLAISQSISDAIDLNIAGDRRYNSPNVWSNVLFKRRMAHWDVTDHVYFSFHLPRHIVTNRGIYRTNEFNWCARNFK